MGYSTPQKQVYSFMSFNSFSIPGDSRLGSQGCCSRLCNPERFSSPSKSKHWTETWAQLICVTWHLKKTSHALLHKARYFFWYFWESINMNRSEKQDGFAASCLSFNKNIVQDFCSDKEKTFLLFYVIEWKCGRPTKRKAIFRFEWNSKHSFTV